IAEREHSLFGAGLFLVAASAAERGVELIFREGLLEAFSLHDVGVYFAAMRNGTYPLFAAFFVDVDDELQAKLFGDVVVAQLVHFAKLPGRIDVHQWKRRLRGVKRLLRQPDHDRRVLADRIEHYWIFEFGDHLAQDVDTLSFE